MQHSEMTYKAERAENMPVPKTWRKLIVWRRTELETKEWNEIKGKSGRGQGNTSAKWHTHLFFIYICIYTSILITVYIYVCISELQEEQSKERSKNPLVLTSTNPWCSAGFPHNGGTERSAEDFSGLSGRCFDFLFHNLVMNASTGHSQAEPPDHHPMTLTPWTLSFPVST